MKNFINTLKAELIKLKRSRIVILSILFFMFIPLMMGLLFLIQKHPEISEKLGLIGTKASLMRLGKGDWDSYMTILNQAIAAIGLIGFGFITSWIFGFEFSDKTIKDLLSVPTSRTAIVMSKFVVLSIWSCILAFTFFISGILFGNMIDISGWSFATFYSHTLIFIKIFLLTILLSPLVAFFASYSRNYLLPMGFVILTLIMANFSGLIGAGSYFPWAIPGILSISSGASGMELHLSSYMIILTTCVAGILGTIFYWKFADQH